MNTERFIITFVNNMMFNHILVQAFIEISMAGVTPKVF